jgi:hypothetical protein
MLLMYFLFMSGLICCDTLTFSHNRRGRPREWNNYGVQDRGLMLDEPYVVIP